MRIIIDMGHTPTSPGASGHLDELYCDREAGKRIIAELKKRGHTVYDSTPADWVAYPQEVNERCAYANSLSNIDLFCSLHLNAGGGHGTEVLYYAGDSTGEWYARKISDNVARALDITDRGPKANDWVGVICNTNHTAVLIEFCFVDSWDDAQAWAKCPWEDLVAAVCDGIEGKVWEKKEESEEEMALEEINKRLTAIEADIKTVKDALKPTIVSDPRDASAKVGNKATFSVEASGVGLSYQWQYYSTKDKKFYNVTSKEYVGLKTPTMKAPATTSRNGLVYRCKVSNEVGAVYSGSAKMTVTK